VPASRSGQINDIDRALPQAIADLGLGPNVTLTVEPGAVVDADSPLARLEGAGSIFSSVIRRGIVIGRRTDVAEPSEVLDDMIDMCRAALNSGSAQSMRASWQVVVDALAQLPIVYARWADSGPRAVVNRADLPSTEFDLIRRVAAFNHEVVRSGNSDAIGLMPYAAAGLVDVGLCAGDLPLVRAASALWLQHLDAVQQIDRSELADRLHGLVGRLAAQAVGVQQSRIEDRDRPLEERLAARTGLCVLFEHNIEAMRLAVNAGEPDRLVALASLGRVGTPLEARADC
jgi:hypothetical protein